MNYWLFLIMYDWPFGGYWKDMVEAGIAAQHYPPGEPNEAKNIKALRQLRKGDSIVAAFRGHRFAGYGVLTSDFYQGGDSLEVYNPDKDDYYEFAERFDCDWTVLPFDSGETFVRCQDLKKQGYDIDLIRGLCVKQMDQDTFRALKARLDRAGARRIIFQPDVKTTESTMPEAELNARWWVYKCNSGQHDYQRAWGDWRDIFGKSGAESWGSSQWIPDLAKLRQGDMVIAYQTDRNEFVGIAQVHQSCDRDSYLYLTPIEIVGVKVHPLKKADPMIAAIPALQPGPVKTIYEISTHDARRLLKAAGAIHKPVLKSTPEAKDINQPPSKVQCTTYRILRDTALAREVKELHNYRCQVCHSDALQLGGGVLYAEAHHIRPLGSTHRGPDVFGNIICVCPNCHVLLDYGAIQLDAIELETSPYHQVGQEYIQYHNTQI